MSNGVFIHVCACFIKKHYLNGVKLYVEDKLSP
jgi:hypothetical protein